MHSSKSASDNRADRGGDGDGTQGTVDGTPAWGPIQSSEEAYVNHGHSFSNNAVYVR